MKLCRTPLVPVFKIQKTTQYVLHTSKLHVSRILNPELHFAYFIISRETSSSHLKVFVIRSIHHTRHLCPLMRHVASPLIRFHLHNAFIRVNIIPVAELQLCMDHRDQSWQRVLRLGGQWLSLESVRINVGQIVGVDVSFLEIAFT